VAVLLTVRADIALGQFQIIHTPLQEAQEGRPAILSFSVPGAGGDLSVEASIFYRTDLQLTYTREPALWQRNRFEARLPADAVQGNTLYYYIQLDYADGSMVRFPSGSPAAGVIETPIRVPQNQPPEGQTARIDYRIMSPLPDEPVAADEALIAIAFFYPEGSVDAGGFRLMVNGLDVTAQAEVTPFLITYVPEELPTGDNHVRLVYRDLTRDIELISWSFAAVPSGSLPDDGLADREPPLTGDVQLTARNQVNAGQNFDFVRGSFNVRGSQGKWTYSANGLRTSQESSRLQPQNRYGLQLAYSDMARLELGHVYPVMNPLLIAGRRINGGHLRINLPSRVFSLQVLHGESVRRVDPLFTDIEQVIRTRELEGGVIVTDTSYVFGLQSGGRGTFTQHISGVRLGFGYGNGVQIGLNAIRVRDLLSSIPYFNEYDPTGMLAWQQGLTPIQQQQLADNPEWLQITRSAAAPVSNTAFAADFQVNLDRNRIRLNSEVGASLLNNDISEGPFTAEKADELGFELDDNLITLFDRLAWLIVINENMNALPVRIENEQAEIIIPTGIFATQHQLGLNYVNNSLNVQYRWIGPDFVSLANNGIRRDIAGITVTDRIRLFRNTVYINLLYEQLQDNLIGQLEATTHTQTIGTGINWFPVARTLPRVNISVRHTTRDNRLSWSNPFLNGEQSGSDLVRNAVLSENDALLQAPTPRLQQTWQSSAALSYPLQLDYATHDIVLSFGTISTDDQRFRYGDFTNLSMGLAVNTGFYDWPLQTRLALNYTDSDGQSGLTKVRIFGVNLGANYTMLNENLLADAEVAALSNRIRTTPLQVDDGGDAANVFNNRFIPDPANQSRDEAFSVLASAGVTYKLYDVHHFRLSGSYTNVSSRVQNLRFSNDHLLQFRYTYYF